MLKGVREQMSNEVFLVVGCGVGERLINIPDGGGSMLSLRYLLGTNLWAKKGLRV